MPDTSLDDFLGGDGSAGEDEASDEEEAVQVDPEPSEGAAAEVDSAESEDETVAGDGDAVDAADEGDDGDWAVEPAVSTYDFSPDEAPCAVCGASVEKRWRADAGLVCPECKEW